MSYEVKVSLSNKHIHLSDAHVEALFGEGYKLTMSKPLLQPGQYACEEKVDVVGPKGALKGIRILAPTRPETQVELSMTDARTIGVKAPIRNSGKLEGTSGCKLVGPCGEVDLESGVIVAARHVHLDPKSAEEAGLKDGDFVKLEIKGDRGVIFNNVLVRCSDSQLAEVHLDTDEGNAAGCGPDTVGYIFK
ncbi:MAG: phosphate propanoyltransferase [Firmicutes bacterium]|nr:phosphate propanoyltransferase [Bacillota bacterium]